jgi:ceramidase
MTFGEHVFLYCERGTNQALLAEPINAVSNVAFLLAALVGLQLVMWRPPEERGPDLLLLPVLVLFIGLGSLAFHLYADEGTALADVLPISVFMLVYLGFALNRFLGVPPGFTVLLVIGFAAIMAMTGQVRCWDGGIGIPGPDIQSAKLCLNGSIFYLPALIALIIVGLVAEERRHRAAPYLLWAAAIFAVSITLRSLDLALCDKVVIEGRKVGTHFAWHVLNALTLFLLLRASLEGIRRLLPESKAEPVPEAPRAAQAEPAPPPDAARNADDGSRPATAIERTLAEGLAPPPKSAKPAKPLAERVASASEQAAKEDATSEDRGEPKVLSPA